MASTPPQSSSESAANRTSLSIIQQVAASIGTAMLSVILFNEVKHRLAPVVAQMQAQAPPGTAPPAATSMRDLPEQVRQLVGPAMAEAYASTFMWALVLLALSLIPALLRLRGQNTAAALAAGSADRDELREPEPVGDGGRG